MPPELIAYRNFIYLWNPRASCMLRRENWTACVRGKMLSTTLPQILYSNL